MPRQGISLQHIFQMISSSMRATSLLFLTIALSSCSHGSKLYASNNNDVIRDTYRCYMNEEECRVNLHKADIDSSKIENCITKTLELANIQRLSEEYVFEAKSMGSVMLLDKIDGCPMVRVSSVPRDNAPSDVYVEVLPF